MDGKVIDFKPRVPPGGTLKSDLISENLYDYLNRDLEEAEVCLKSITEKCPVVLKEPLSELLYLKGDKLVPALFLLNSKLFGPAGKNQHRMAAALDALYLALNIHDLLKSDRQESGKKERDVTFSKHILCGDYLLSFALSMVADFPEFIRGMSEIICRNVEASFIETSLDTITYFEPALYRKTYLQKISHKAGSPYALSCALGGWSCGIPASKIEKLAYYGHYLGLARQIEGDLLDFENNIHNWLVKGRGELCFSLPLIYIIENSAFPEKLLNSLTLNFWGKNERALWEQELNKDEHKMYINNIVRSNCEQAISSLSNFPDGEARDILLSLPRELHIL